MTKTRNYLLLVICLCLTQYLLGQEMPASLQQSHAFDTSLLNGYEDHGWLYLTESSEIAIDDFWQDHKTELGLGPDDAMQLKKSHVDKDGRIHKRYQQTYKNLEVEGAEYGLHAENGYVYLGHGKLIKDLALSITPAIPKAEALQAALTHIGADLYGWELEQWEEAYQEEMEDTTASLYPEGKLRIGLLQGMEMQKENYRLCWFFRIAAASPEESYELQIDATGGSLLSMRSLSRACSGSDVLSTGSTSFYQQQSFVSVQRSSDQKFVLQDCGRDIETKDYSGYFNIWNNWVSNSFNNMPDIENGSSNWTGKGFEVMSHWGAQQAWQYFDSTFQFTGWNGNGKRVRVVTNWQGPNAQVDVPARFKGWPKNYLIFGRDPGFLNHPTSAIDLLSHEYTHGVIKWTADLTNEKMPGSIAEAYADIFGFMIEREAEKSNPLASLDWHFGEDYSLGIPLRNWELPLSTQNPNVMWGGHFKNPFGCTPNPLSFSDGGNNNCGIHENSTIISKAFNLLSGSIYQQNGLQVPGIGPDAAAAIAFKALTDYLHTQSHFWDCRSAWIQAAKDLFGSCSLEVYSTARAFAAVGLGKSADLCVGIGPLPNRCDPKIFEATRFENPASGSTTGFAYSWSFPTSWTAAALYNRLAVQSAPPGAVGGTVIVVVSYNGQPLDTARAFVSLLCEEDNRDDRIRRMARSLPKAKIYPNPAREYVMVDLGEMAGATRLELFDLAGKRLSSIPIKDAITKFPLQGLPAGYYLMQISQAGLKASYPLHIQQR